MALRSFGTDPALVSDMVSAQVKGFANAGVLCCAKHFPGIGGMTGDSHEGAIVTQNTLDELRIGELAPFEAAIEADVPMVHGGPPHRPERVRQRRARLAQPPRPSPTSCAGSWAFKASSSPTRSPWAQSATSARPTRRGVMALLAGADLVLMPEDFASAYRGVLDAVCAGTLSRGPHRPVGHAHREGEARAGRELS